MTKLTEEILRAQTCPFTLTTKMSPSCDICVKYLGIETVVFEDADGEDSGSIGWLIAKYKLPEPEPKLITMYECVDMYGDICFRDADLRIPELNKKILHERNDYITRVPNGRTMQLDISGEQWKWVENN